MMKGTQAYVQTQVTTIGQGEILILLYDGAIKFLHQAKEKIFDCEYAEKGRLISKAIDIVNELDICINDKANEELARNLHGLYEICSTRLLEANLRLDVKLIDSVIDILANLRSSFADIVNLPEARAAAETIAAKLQNNGNSTSHAVSIPKNQPTTGIGRAAAQQAYGGRVVRPAMGAATPSQALSAPNPAMPSAVPTAPTTLPRPAMPSAVPNPSPIANTMPQDSLDIPDMIPANHLPTSFTQRKLTATNLYGKIANS